MNRTRRQSIETSFEFSSVVGNHVPVKSEAGAPSGLKMEGQPQLVRDLGLLKKLDIDVGEEPDVELEGVATVQVPRDP